MKVNSQTLVEGAKASGLRALITNSQKISDGSGAPPAKFRDVEYISNSYLSMLKRELLGEPQFFGDESFLKFGNELHKRLLKPKEKKDILDKEKEELLASMLESLYQYKPLMKMMKGARLEQIDVKPVHGQMVKVILDIEKGTRGTDLKSTSCTSQAAFETAARRYGYFKQGFLYMGARKLKDFDLVGISKKKKNGVHPIFPLDMRDFPVLLKEGAEEAKMLIDSHKSLKFFYGRH
jgi:hypothetical protein